MQSPVVGRVQTREGVFDLTREAFFEGGPAFELSPAVAHAMAEAADALDRDEGNRVMGDVPDVGGAAPR